ncbi:MAG: LamG-like jellyroll fold domain-containing protein, partial [Candidatus Neomarinimicrobiota bacterium]
MTIKFIKTLFLSAFTTLTLAQSNNDLENVNYSLSFDGVDDFVGQFPTIDNFPFSAFCWFKTTDDIAYLMQWHSNNMSGHGPHSPDLYIENGLLKAMSWSPENSDLYIESTSSVNDNNWHFAGFTHDSDGTFCLYLDGELIDCFNNPNTGREVNLILGRYNTNEKYFSGNMDNVQVWDSALSQEQIHTNMNLSLIGNETGLVGYWNFNEGSGNVLTDITPNNNNGIVHGGAVWSDEIPIFGCTDLYSSNYDINANIDDGSCEYLDNGNYALSFDGTDDYVVGSASQSLDASITNEITISAWIKVDDFTNGQTIISHGGDGFNQYN